ncbi:potassium channel family protein [Thermodesulfobacteriota bacterium]
MSTVATKSVFQKRLNLKHFSVTIILLGLILLLSCLNQSTANGVVLVAITLSAWLVSNGGRKPFIIFALVGALGSSLAVLNALGPEFTGSIREHHVGHAIIITVLALLLYSTYAILKSLLRATHVSVDQITGGVNIYLIIGFIWANVYLLLERVRPHSFAVDLSAADIFHKFVYFSFVTLTTLGYGDIAPKEPIAESLVTLEAIVGHMYVPVVVTYLLSLHIGQRLSGQEGEEVLNISRETRAGLDASCCCVHRP